MPRRFDKASHPIIRLDPTSSPAQLPSSASSLCCILIQPPSTMHLDSSSAGIESPSSGDFARMHQIVSVYQRKNSITTAVSPLQAHIPSSPSLSLLPLPNPKFATCYIFFRLAQASLSGFSFSLSELCCAPPQSCAALIHAAGLTIQEPDR
jgi:hypothetical protein